MIDALKRTLRRLRLLTRLGERERAMDEEMRFHLEMEAAELERRGVPAVEARRRARLAFGGVERFKEAARHARGTRLAEDLWQDSRYALRQLAASPGFAAATVLTLALGIGTTTMMYSARRAYRSEGLALPAPARLVYVAQGPGGCLACASLAPGNYAALKAGARALAGLSLIADWEPVFRGEDAAELVDAARVTTDFFATLDVRPLLGRTFRPADSASTVVVVSEATWQARFAADSSALGRTVVLDRVPYTVIGVVGNEAAFWPVGTGLWTPLVLSAEDEGSRTGGRYRAVGRLAAGAALATAASEVAGVGGQLTRAFPAELEGTSFSIAPLLDLQLNQLRADPAERVFRAAVALVLLIACINLASLLIARLTTRRRELAVRRALGAASARIARQLVAETALLTGLAALVGLLVAAAGSRLLLGASLPLDGRTFGVALSTGVVTGLVVALWPALRFARPPLADELRQGARTATGSRGTTRGRRALVVAELALAIVVMAAAGVLTRSYEKIYRIDPGFSGERVLALRLRGAPPAAGAEDDPAHFDRLVETLSALPGIERVGAAEGLPFGRGGGTEAYQVEGRSGEDAGRPSALSRSATPGYFETLGVPLLRGRGFAAADHAEAPRVAIVNRALVERSFSGQDPIGQRLIVDGERWEIVGVSGDVFQGDVEQLRSPELYRPLQQVAAPTVWIVARTRGDPAELMPVLASAVRRFDPDLVLSRTSSMDALRAEDMGSERRMLRLMAAFAVASLLICGIGLYGLISYSVAQRTREFGVRLALGAARADVLALVLAQAVRLAALGALIGIPGALLALPLMRSMLFGVSPADPLTLAAVALLACGVGVASAYLPARRATRISPMSTLGDE